MLKVTARSFWTCTIALVMLQSAIRIASGANLTLESRVKAAFIFNFAKFIDWPKTSFPSSSSPITVCILGAQDFEAVLQQTLAGKTAHGRRFVTKHLNDGALPSECDVLFIGSAASAQARQILQKIRGLSVVTVSDLPDFNRQGGMIRFFLHQNKVRFAINLDAVHAAKIHVSSQLLKVSQVTHSGTK